MSGGGATHSSEVRAMWLGSTESRESSKKTREETASSWDHDDNLGVDEGTLRPMTAGYGRLAATASTDRGSEARGGATGTWNRRHGFG
jgi:hypothetical protein